VGCHSTRDIAAKLGHAIREHIIVIGKLKIRPGEWRRRNGDILRHRQSPTPAEPAAPRYGNSLNEISDSAMKPSSSTPTTMTTIRFPLETAIT
jgi:hypothetical protein